MESSIYFTIIECPNCGANIGIGIDLNSNDNVLKCEGCGVKTEITIDAQYKKTNL